MSLGAPYILRVLYYFEIAMRTLGVYIQIARFKAGRVKNDPSLVCREQNTFIDILKVLR